MGEPAGTTRLSVLAVAGTHVGAVSAHFEPLTQEALVISRLESYFRFRDLPQRSALLKCVKHFPACPIHDGPPRDKREGCHGGLESQPVSTIRSCLTEQPLFLRLIVPIHQAQVHPDTISITGHIRRRECGRLNNLTPDRVEGPRTKVSHRVDAHSG